MRINIYAEELTDEVEEVTKVVGDRTFYGIRVYLKSAPELHDTDDDDDRSAITFWGANLPVMTRLIVKMMDTANSVPDE